WAKGRGLGTNDWGGSRSDFVVIGSRIVANPGGVYVTGTTNGVFNGEVGSGSRDVFVAKLDPGTGAVRWIRQFGSAGFDVTHSRFGGVAADNSAVYVVANLNVDPTTGVVGTAVLRKYDTDGNLQWTVARDNCAIAWSGVTTHASDVYVIGETCQPPLVSMLEKYDTTGTLLWTRTID